jgi:hypothetical protein
MTDQWTCGKGLAANSELPKRTGELITAVADVLELHQRALDLSDPNSRREYDAYRQLANDHRLAGRQLSAIGEAMAGYRDLPMGRHDMEAMNAPAVRQSFERVVGLEKQLLTLLQQRIPQDEQLLKQMGATA